MIKWPLQISIKFEIKVNSPFVNINSLLTSLFALTSSFIGWFAFCLTTVELPAKSSTQIFIVTY